MTKNNQLVVISPFISLQVCFYFVLKDVSIFTISFVVFFSFYLTFYFDILFCSFFLRTKKTIVTEICKTRYPIND